MKSMAYDVAQITTFEQQNVAHTATQHGLVIVAKKDLTVKI